MIFDNPWIYQGDARDGQDLWVSLVDGVSPYQVHDRQQDPRGRGTTPIITGSWTDVSLARSASKAWRAATPPG
ncbi:hypothetical protein [Metallosphaera yellowstonensis]|uniref:hypothetical protein n=1 Tax=Metallosphaera yellowstonensis TaxID=1111107 RepID=UPI00064FCEA3|nr:hypothetical protein [Metallosphaera yellowstonensis]